MEDTRLLRDIPESAAICRRTCVLQAVKLGNLRIEPCLMPHPNPEGPTASPDLKLWGNHCTHLSLKGKHSECILGQ